jgi:hypothetical protein
MKHFENFEFYGKVIREFNQKEIELLMNDLLLVTTIHLMNKGQVVTEEIDGEMIEIGSVENYIKCVDERHRILRELLNMENETDLLLLLVSESSNYSFDGFMKRMVDYMNKGVDVTQNNITKVLGVELHMN